MAISEGHVACLRVLTDRCEEQVLWLTAVNCRRIAIPLDNGLWFLTSGVDRVNAPRPEKRNIPALRRCFHLGKSRGTCRGGGVLGCLFVYLQEKLAAAIPFQAGEVKKRAHLYPPLNEPWRPRSQPASSRNVRGSRFFLQFLQLFCCASNIWQPYFIVSRFVARTRVQAKTHRSSTTRLSRARNNISKHWPGRTTRGSPLSV